jgi:signal transduction histidine kinase
LVKLAAMLVAPALIATILAALQVRREIQYADTYESTQELVALRDVVDPLVAQLQYERTLAASQVTDADKASYQRQSTVVDAAAATLLATAKQNPGLCAICHARLEELARALAGLSATRQSAKPAEFGTGAITSYGQIIFVALNLNQALVVESGNVSTYGPASALLDLQYAQEQIRLEQAAVLVGLTRGYVTEPEIRMLEAADAVLRDKLAVFRAIAPMTWQQQLEQAMSAQEVSTRGRLLQAVLAQQIGQGRRTAGSGVSSPATSAVEWNQASDGTVMLLSQVEKGLGEQVRQVVADQQESASDRAGLASVILITTLLIVGLVGGIIGRYLLLSLGTLRQSALDVAQYRLPEAVALIGAGRGEEVRVDPVPVHSTDEFGQVARAFDEVYGQAIRVAAEQASLRSSLGGVFVNLSRRSQGLVERQLRLMEQLERHEENPEQLANLFKLDHLATRMRRNNENLMVLSGVDLARRFTKPLPLADVLRAAVSEIEHYQRAMVRSAPDVTVLGYAAGDLVRLIAELLDNATAFSRPDTQVVLDGRRGDDGVIVIDVLDQGIGMTEAELAEANSRVTTGLVVDVPASRQMGLFVVGTLANRHSMVVWFTARQDAEGISATVTVPKELLVDQLRGTPTTGRGRDASTPQPPRLASGTDTVTWPSSEYLDNDAPAEIARRDAPPTVRPAVASTWFVAKTSAASSPHPPVERQEVSIEQPAESVVTEPAPASLEPTSYDWFRAGETGKRQRRFRPPAGSSAQDQPATALPKRGPGASLPAKPTRTADTEAAAIAPRGARYAQGIVDKYRSRFRQVDGGQVNSSGTDERRQKDL